jgi:hypothetical protein
MTTSANKTANTLLQILNLKSHPENNAKTSLNDSLGQTHKETNKLDTTLISQK